MKRNKYFDYIEEKLSILSRRIDTRGKLNILDFHLHGENFYLYFFNQIYGLNLENLNDYQQNVEAIDLIDKKNKILIQVSATSTKNKLDNTFQKDIFKKCPDYRFKFISISKDASKLRKLKYNIPPKINFEPSIDIHDNVSILKSINSFPIGKLKDTYEFIKSELGKDSEILNLDSNLAKIVNIFSKEDLTNISEIQNKKAFKIQKKITYNNLKKSIILIDSYKTHSTRLNKIYQEYDKQGVNKSLSILKNINNIYLRTIIKDECKNSDEVFLKVIEETISKVKQSQCIENIFTEELDLCVTIIVVDAFIRCEIFENPN